MSIQTTSTAVLTRTVEILHEPASFLLDTFFTGLQTDPGVEEIHFDVDSERPRATPFVHPTVAGQVVEGEGHETKSFSPAYAKDKRVLRPNETLKRVIGEPLTGSLSPTQRRDRRVAQNLLRMRRALTRRDEIMASEAVRLGQTTVSGEKYPTVVVDFQRDAALTVTLVGAARWGEVGVEPLDDLEDWTGLVQEKSGGTARTVVFDPEAWKLARQNQRLLDLLDTRRGSSSRAELGPMARGQGREKARFVGTIGDFDFWVYSETYVDDAGVTQNVMPANTVIVGAEDDVEGVRAYGSIMDEEADFAAERFFVKSWAEKDPSVRYILGQSAPLMVPYRINACMAITVR